MKRILMVLSAWLVFNSSFAQSSIQQFNSDPPPITKTGIQLPQLITIDLNRSTLKFKIDLSQNITNPNLQVDFHNLISDSRKQFTLSGGAKIDHSLNIRPNDFQDFYTLNGLSSNLGADLKLFNGNDYFIQIGTSNFVNKLGGLMETDFVNTLNSVHLGFGKGRINYVNDGASAIAITDKLTSYGLMSRDLTEKEYLLLVNKINELKNRRKFVNRSYPLTEPEEIYELLSGFGVLPENINVLEIIDEIYRYEPIFERTSGKQLSVTATASYQSSNIIPNFNEVGLRANISYAIHTPLNLKWQHNASINGYIFASEGRNLDPTFEEDRLKQVGINISNDFHYLVDTRISYSLSSTVGYDFMNRKNYFQPFGDPFYDQKGFYLRLNGELHYQITRTISTTFGINFDWTPLDRVTGLNLGVNF